MGDWGYDNDDSFPIVITDAEESRASSLPAVKPDLDIRSSDKRVGNNDRDYTVRLLTAAHAQGYLSDEVYEARVSQALITETKYDLMRLTKDLPEDEIMMRTKSGAKKASDHKRRTRKKLSGWRLLARIVPPAVALIGICACGVILARNGTHGQGWEVPAGLLITIGAGIASLTIVVYAANKWDQICAIKRKMARGEHVDI